MSFENIQLPEFLIADLYKDCLIDLENIKSESLEINDKAAGEPSNKEAVEHKTDLKFLGENKQQVSIVVKCDSAAIIEQDDLQFLTNVLKACELNLGDIAILNISQQPISYNQLTEELKPRVVLLFQVEPAEIHLPFSIPDFQLQAYAEVSYLKAPALNNINLPSQEARLLKTKLWANLQKIFGLNS